MRLAGKVAIVTGGTREQNLIETLGVGNARPLLNPSLRETFALAAAADIVFCNSSMLLHAAAAFSKPTVVVLGPESPPAADHQMQWGYPGVSVTLERRASPADALAAARALGGI